MAAFKSVRQTTMLQQCASIVCFDLRGVSKCSRDPELHAGRYEIDLNQMLGNYSIGRATRHGTKLTG